jgi:hypothetical protein
VELAVAQLEVLEMERQTVVAAAAETAEETLQLVLVVQV